MPLLASRSPPAPPVGSGAKTFLGSLTTQPRCHRCPHHPVFNPTDRMIIILACVTAHNARQSTTSIDARRWTGSCIMSGKISVKQFRFFFEPCPSFSTRLFAKRMQTAAQLLVSLVQSRQRNLQSRYRTRISSRIFGVIALATNSDRTSHRFLR